MKDLGHFLKNKAKAQVSEYQYSVILNSVHATQTSRLNVFS